MALPVFAPQIRPAVAGLLLQDGTFRLEITLNLEAVLAEIGSQARSTADSPNGTRYDLFRAMDSATLKAAFNPEAFAAHMQVLLDNQPGRAEVTEVTIPEAGDLTKLRDSRILVTGALGTTKTLRLGWDAAYGSVIIRLMDGENDNNAYLNNGTLTDPISTKDATVISFWRNLLNYIGVEYYHILPMGLDHVLFIIGLFLLSTQLKLLLWQATTFTLAHSVTLVLGVLGVLVIPASIMEPLIALSIMDICIENIFMMQMSRWQMAVIFMFDLLHGKGFAGTLKAFGLSTNNIASGLIGFNLGVELGQILIILICFFAGRVLVFRQAMVSAGGCYSNLDRDRPDRGLLGGAATGVYLAICLPSGTAEAKPRPGPAATRVFSSLKTVAFSTGVYPP